MWYHEGLVLRLWYEGVVPRLWYEGVVPRLWYEGVVPRLWYEANKKKAIGQSFASSSKGWVWFPVTADCSLSHPVTNTFQRKYILASWCLKSSL